MIEMVKVSTLMQKVKMSFDLFNLKSVNGWHRMLEDKMADTQTPAIIRAIQSRGFIDPICISKFPNGFWELGNGHHRLCIAILLGLDEIPVDFSGWDSSASERHCFVIDNDYQDSDPDEAAWISETIRASMMDKVKAVC